MIPAPRMRPPDEFGDRMKAYEVIETGRRLDVSRPVYARIDGRAFSTFTRGMAKPFDEGLTTAMIETARHLVAVSHALIGYTQSDEISLVWLAEGTCTDIFFSGKIQKMVSVLASIAAAKFSDVCHVAYRSRLPCFDARVFQLPNKTEAANAFLWRAMDARKNAISMVAQSIFNYKQLFEKDQSKMLEMIAEHGIDFKSFPNSFTRGSFVRRTIEMRELNDTEMARIPKIHRPSGPISRSHVVIVDMPPFNMVGNREAVIFDGADPIQRTTALKRKFP